MILPLQQRVGSAAQHVVTDNAGKLIIKISGRGGVSRLVPMPERSNPVTISMGTMRIMAQGLKQVFPFPCTQCSKPNLDGHGICNTRRRGEDYFSLRSRGCQSWFQFFIRRGSTAFYTSGWNINQSGLAQTGSYQVVQPSIPLGGTPADGDR